MQDIDSLSDLPNSVISEEGDTEPGSPDQMVLTAPESAAGQRLDKYLASEIDTLSRARIQMLIDSGDVTLHGAATRASYKLSSGDRIVVTVPLPSLSELVPESLPLAILYEDSDLLVIDKPAGMVVHPAPGHASGTLVNALLAHVPDLKGIGGEVRPGIVHRLDKDTSGLIVAAKHERAHRWLAAQFKERQMDKRYQALVDGGPSAESGTIHSPIGRDPRKPQQMAAVEGGRDATTHFRVLQRFSRHTLLECKPETGRTHQVRVHLAAIGCPVTGDRVYGAKRPSIPLDRHFLHAWKLTFTLLDGSRRTFEAPLPTELEDTLTQIA